jgi:hypothetical protein
LKYAPMDQNVRTALIWIRIGANGTLLKTRQWTLGFEKKRGHSWVPEHLPEERFCSTDLASYLKQYKYK